MTENCKNFLSYNFETQSDYNNLKIKLEEEFKELKKSYKNIDDVPGIKVHSVIVDCNKLCYLYKNLQNLNHDKAYFWTNGWEHKYFDSEKLAEEYSDSYFLNITDKGFECDYPFGSGLYFLINDIKKNLSYNLETQSDYNNLKLELEEKFKELKKNYKNIDDVPNEIVSSVMIYCNKLCWLYKNLQDIKKNKAYFWTNGWQHKYFDCEKSAKEYADFSDLYTYNKGFDCDYPFGSGVYYLINDDSDLNKSPK